MEKTFKRKQKEVVTSLTDAKDFLQKTIDHIASIKTLEDLEQSIAMVFIASDHIGDNRVETKGGGAGQAEYMAEALMEFIDRNPPIQAAMGEMMLERIAAGMVQMEGNDAVKH